MNRRVILCAIGLWVVFAVCGILNGIFREFVVSPRLGASAGHILSTFILCGVVLLGSSLLVRRLALKDTTVLLGVGALWLILTVAFEFGFGHFVMGHPWSLLFADYNLLRGRIWILVPVTTLFGPLLMARVRR